MKVTIQGCLIRLTDKQHRIIEDMIRRFESATRYTYARLCNETPIPAIRKDVQRKFELNSFWAECAMDRAKAAYKTAQNLTKEGKLQSPRKLIWGGRRNFELRSRGKISKEQWRHIRSNQFWSIGQKQKKGNRNLRIERTEDGYQLRITIGKRQWMRCRLWIPEKFRAALNKHLEGEPCYTVRVKRGDDDRYRVYITFDAELPPQTADFSEGAIGIDLNPAGQAWTETNAAGQLLKSGWVDTPELQYARRGKRDWIVSQVARQVAKLARRKKKGIVIEDLKFRRGTGHGRKLNRIFSNFIYRRLSTAIAREAAKQGVAIKQVNPAYSSVIGKLKYQSTYPHLAVHNAAAYVLARRGLGFIDMPKGRQRALAYEALEARLGKKKLHYWSFWRSLKSGAYSANGKSHRTTGEDEQGIAPTRSGGEIPPRYRRKGVSSETQPGNPAPLVGVLSREGNQGARRVK